MLVARQVCILFISRIRFSNKECTLVHRSGFSNEKLTLCLKIYREIYKLNPCYKQCEISFCSCCNFSIQYLSNVVSAKPNIGYHKLVYDIQCTAKSNCGIHFLFFSWWWCGGRVCLCLGGGSGGEGWCCIDLHCLIKCSYFLT